MVRLSDQYEEQFELVKDRTIREILLLGSVENSVYLLKDEEVARVPLVTQPESVREMYTEMLRYAIRKNLIDAVVVVGLAIVSLIYSSTGGDVGEGVEEIEALSISYDDKEKNQKLLIYKVTRLENDRVRLELINKDSDEPMHGYFFDFF